MRTDEQTWQAVKRANPVPDRDVLFEGPEEMAMRYDTLTAKRDTKDRAVQPAPGGHRPPRRSRALGVAVASFVLMFGVVGVVALLINDTEPDTAPADQVTTIAAAPTTTDAPTTSAAPGTTATTGAVFPTSPPGQVTFTGQQRWEEPVFFTDHNGLPTVFAGLGPPQWAVPATQATLVACTDMSCETTETRNLPALAEMSFPLLGGDPSHHWWAAIRDDGSPVIAVVAEEQTGPASFEATINLVTCGSPACETASQKIITRVRSDAAALPMPFHIRLALGPANEPIVAFTGWYGHVTTIDEGDVWKDDEGSAVAVATCSDAACTSAPAVTVLETVSTDAGHVAPYGRLMVAALPQGDVAVVYGVVRSDDETTGETRYALCRGGDCSAAAMTTLETWLNTGTGGPVMALGANRLPVFAHWRWWDEGQHTLLTMCRNPECTDTDTTVLPSFRDRVDLVIGAGGNPVLTFTEDERAAVVSCEDPLCMEFEQTFPLGDAEYQSAPTVIVGDETAYLAYYDTLADRALHIRRCTDLVCSRVVAQDEPARLVTVPDFEGVYDGDTRGWAESIGLILVVVGDPPDDPGRAVPIVMQEPAAGSAVPAGSEVTIWIGSS